MISPNLSQVCREFLGFSSDFYNYTENRWEFCYFDKLEIQFTYDLQSMLNLHETYYPKKDFQKY